jgi:hypothetical protein
LLHGPAAGRPADRALAREASQQRALHAGLRQACQQRFLTCQQFHAVLHGLGKAVARVQHDALSDDAGYLGRLKAFAQESGYLFDHVVVMRQGLHGGGSPRECIRHTPAVG